MLRMMSVLAIALLLCARPSAAEFTSYAIVRNDGSLLIRNNVVRLFGVYIPDPGQFCDARLRPVFCGNRAASALNLRNLGFVTCEEMGVYDDGSISAICWKRGADLGAYLISQGLALAGPDAPFEYQALERIAESNGRGIWAFRVDQIIQPFSLLQPRRVIRR
jgi:endonuclease YncB( thermonuclease family)